MTVKVMQLYPKSLDVFFDLLHFFLLPEALFCRELEAGSRKTTANSLRKSFIQ